MHEISVMWEAHQHLTLLDMSPASLDNTQNSDAQITPGHVLSLTDQ